MYQHKEPSMADLQLLPKHFLTAPGPWDPHQFYDGQATIDGPCNEHNTFNTMKPTPQVSAATPKDHNLLTGDATMKTFLAPPSEPPDKPMFFNALCKADKDEDTLVWHDTVDQMKPKERCGRAFHLVLDYNHFIHKPEVNHFLDTIKDEELLGQNEPFDSFSFAVHAKASLIEAKRLQPYLAW